MHSKKEIIVEKKAKILELLKKGLSKGEISKTLKCDNATINSVIIKNNFKYIHKTASSEIRKKEIIDAWEKKDGMSVLNFLKKMKVGETTLKKILAENGTPYQPQKNGVNLKALAKAQKPTPKEQTFEKVKPLNQSVYINDLPNTGFCKYPKIISSKDGIDTHEWCGQKSGESSWCPEHHVICISRQPLRRPVAYFPRKKF